MLIKDVLYTSVDNLFPILWEETKRSHASRNQEDTDYKFLEGIEFGERLTAQEVIQSPRRWTSPVFWMKKHDGSLRVCADFKVHINRSIASDPYPLPTIKTISLGWQMPKWISRKRIGRFRWMRNPWSVYDQH